MNTGFLQKEEKVTAWRNPLWDEWIDMTKAMISHGWKGPTENFPGFGRSSCFIGAHRFRKKNPPSRTGTRIPLDYGDNCTP